MACFFDIHFSNNPYITPWGTIGRDGKPEDHGWPAKGTYNSLKGCQGNRYPYHVQPGENLYSIAKRLEVDLERIMAANPGLDPYRLGIGQTICIPACPPGLSERYIHRVHSLWHCTGIWNQHRKHSGGKSGYGPRLSEDRAEAVYLPKPALILCTDMDLSRDAAHRKMC